MNNYYATLSPNKVCVKLPPEYQNKKVRKLYKVYYVGSYGNTFWKTIDKHFHILQFEENNYIARDRSSFYFDKGIELYRIDPHNDYYDLENFSKDL